MNTSSIVATITAPKAASAAAPAVNTICIAQDTHRNRLSVVFVDHQQRIIASKRDARQRIGCQQGRDGTLAHAGDVHPPFFVLHR